MFTEGFKELFNLFGERLSTVIKIYMYCKIIFEVMSAVSILIFLDKTFLEIIERVKFYMFHLIRNYYYTERTSFLILNFIINDAGYLCYIND